MLRSIGSYFRVASALCVGTGFVVSASGDVVKLNDGRVFEGTILVENDQEVEIDTMVSGIRARLTFQMAEVTSTKKTELAEDFYSPAPGEVSTADRSKRVSGADLYIEVPIVGTVGTEVLADGVGRALSYAQRNAIEHVVFRVDSDGGSLDEMQTILREIQEHAGDIEMHALVSRCLGDALAVPMMCDTVTFLPGAIVGGSETVMAEGAEGMDEELEQTLRTDLARKASAASQAKGRPGTLIRAMIDPSEQVAAWEDESGEAVIGRTVPEGVEPSRVIVRVPAGELLVLDGPQLKRLGAPIAQTDAAGLGDFLDIDKWTAESDYGIEVMSKTVEHQKKVEEESHAKQNQSIARNIERRKSADATLQQGIKQAAEWDPSEHSYATYQSSGGRKRWGGEYTDSRDTNRLTKQSRAEWAQRSEAAMGYLSQAAKAARSLKKLDAEAVKLGLEPTYGPGELDVIIQDLTVKYKFLSANRNKKNV